MKDLISDNTSGVVQVICDNDVHFYTYFLTYSSCLSFLYFFLLFIEFFSNAPIFQDVKNLPGNKFHSNFDCDSDVHFFMKA